MYANMPFLLESYLRSFERDHLIQEFLWVLQFSHILLHICTVYPRILYVYQIALQYCQKGGTAQGHFVLHYETKRI
jgi:hypothetical protein